MRRLAGNWVVRLAVFTVIAGMLVWPMLPAAGFLNEFRDAQVMTLHERAAVDAIRRFGQLPLWDPWYCGGLYGLGAPQSRFASPTLLLSLLFGVERAEPLVVFVFAILGMEGTYRFLRLRVTDAFAAIRVAPLFALSGYFAFAYFRGWTNFFGFQLVPFVLLGVTQTARGRTSGIAVGAVSFGIMMGFGGTFAAPLVAVAATVEGIRALVEQPPSRRGRSALMLLALATFMATVSAVRLLPIAETLAAAPRIMAGTPGHSPKTLLYFLVKSVEVKGGDLEPSGMFFVGGAFVGLVVLGGADRRSIRPLAVVVFFLWLAAGYARKPPLFALLRELPVFAALRYPERFLWLGVLFACEPAANALAMLPRLGAGPRWRTWSNVVLTVTVAATIGTQISNFSEVGKARELGAVAVDRAKDFHQARGNRWLAAHYDGVGVGSLSCWETHPVVMSPKLRGDLAAEEYLVDQTAGTVQRESWSPNRIVVRASLTRSGRLLVNQNWHPGWRASVGIVVSDDGLLAVDLPVGQHDVELKFEPMSAVCGGAVTAVALASLLLLVAGRRHRRNAFRRGSALRTTALVLAPPLVLALFIVEWHEPRYPAPPMRNANGTPTFVEVAAADAKTERISFEIPVVVEALKFAAPNSLQNLSLDVYLRRTGSLSRTTAMFVHVLRREGQEPPPPPEPGKEEVPVSFKADHQVVGGSFYLSDAPRDALIHDAVGVNVSKAARGTYDVMLGFGHVSDRRGHAKVQQHGAMLVADELVRVGSFTLR